MLRALVDARRTDHIDIVAHVVLYVLRRQPTRHFDQRPSLVASAPFILQILRGNLDAIAREVVQHNHICPSLNSRISLLLALALNLNLDRKTPRSLRRRNSRRNRTPTSPDMVVLEHRHRTQIHTVRITPAHQHPILLHQPKPRRSLPRSRQRILIPSPPQQRKHLMTLRRNPRTPRQQIQRNPLAQQQIPHRPTHNRALLLLF